MDLNLIREFSRMEQMEAERAAFNHWWEAMMQQAPPPFRNDRERGLAMCVAWAAWKKARGK